MVGLAPKWVRLAPIGTNPVFFQIRFHCIWPSLNSDLKKPRICPIWGQSDPLGAKPNIPDQSDKHTKRKDGIGRQ